MEETAGAEKAANEPAKIGLKGKNEFPVRRKNPRDLFPSFFLLWQALIRFVDAFLFNSSRLLII